MDIDRDDTFDDVLLFLRLLLRSSFSLLDSRRMVDACFPRLRVEEGLLDWGRLGPDISPSLRPEFDRDRARGRLRLLFLRS